MQTLADILHPVSVEAFFATYYGRSALHIPASSGSQKAALLGWNRFSELLDQTSIWTPQTLKLVENTEPVAPTDYCRLVRDQTGERLVPDPAKVQLLLAKGASLIAGDVQSLTPEISQLTQVLGRAFSASAQANVYCSFKGVQAFGTHYDLTDVIAIQTQGQKLWRIYAAKADNPIAMPMSGPEVKDYFVQTRGPLVAEIMMAPGDVLYLPRGTYHDALAQDGASLHVTYALAPLHGRVLFGLLEQAAMQSRDFRAYLPPAALGNGVPLQNHLRQLGHYLAQVMASPAFKDEVAMAQEQITPRHSPYSLPQPAPLTLYRRLPAPAPAFTGPVAHVMDHALSQNQFSLEALVAQFTFVSPDEVRTAVVRAEAAGAVARLQT